jgi:tRNA pseudouridine55 synthase
MNRLLVVKKPIFISSNSYLSKIKRKYKTKKAGFSGTLDPFAKGSLIVAFGQYSKLFRFIEKTPKTYKATIWLGAKSVSIDLENIEDITIDKELIKQKQIENILENLKGEIEYHPPKFSAKKIDGKRAYELARKDIDFNMKKSKMTIYNIKLINYNHPFISFEVTVSEGAYIRSICEIITNKLNRIGTLSYLERVNEGKFYFENEKSLNPLEFLPFEENIFQADEEIIKNGKKIDIDNLKFKEEKIYILNFDNFFSIIEIKDNEVKYLLNRIEKN